MKRIPCLGFVLVLLALVAGLSPTAAAPTARPAAVPSDCLPVSTSWDDAPGPPWAYEHPGQTYGYEVFISVGCPDDGRVANFMLAFNAGPGGVLSAPAFWDSFPAPGMSNLGCGPGVNPPGSALAQCQQYTSWNTEDNQYWFSINNTPTTSGCGGSITQAHRLKYNTGTPTNPVWQELIYKQRTIIWRYCT